MVELDATDGLGEKVCDVLVGWAESDLNRTVEEYFSDEVQLDVEVFGLRVDGVAACDGDGRLVVLHQLNGAGVTRELG